MSHLEKDDRLRILVREIYSGNGEARKALNVFCRRRGECLSVDDCTECDHCNGFVLDPSGRQSFLMCHYGEKTTLQNKPGRSETVVVSELMTRDVVCVTPEISVEQVTKIFLEKRISGAPVIDPDGAPLGIVSKTDLLRDSYDRVGLEEDRGPLRIQTDQGYEYEFGPGFHSELIAKATVEEIMTRVAYTLRPSTPVGQAAALMSFEGIHRIPVVDESGRVVGLLSSLDVLRWLAQEDGYLLRQEGV